MIYPEKELKERNKEIEKLKKEIKILKDINKNDKSFFDEPTLSIMTLNFLETHLKEVESYLNQLKKIIKNKKTSRPKIRLYIKDKKYVYINYYDYLTKKSKSKYIGKYTDLETINAIEALLKKHPEIENKINNT